MCGSVCTRTGNTCLGLCFEDLAISDGVLYQASEGDCSILIGRFKIPIASPEIFNSLQQEGLPVKKG